MCVLFSGRQSHGLDLVSLQRYSRRKYVSDSIRDPKLDL